MGHESLHASIRKRFRDEVAIAEGLHVAYDNAPGTNPEDEPWIRWEIVEGGSNAVEFGSTVVQERTTGRAVAAIHVPINLGDREALRLADVVKAAFRRVTADGVLYRTPEVRPQGRVGKWWQVNVSCPWQADEFV